MQHMAQDRRALAPAGLRVTADPGLRLLAEGRTLVGGVGLRVVKLSEPGAAVVGAWLAGRPVGDSDGERRLARRLLDAGMLHPVVAPGDGDDITVVVPVRSDSVGEGPERRASSCDNPIRGLLCRRHLARGDSAGGNPARSTVHSTPQSDNTAGNPTEADSPTEALERLLRRLRGLRVVVVDDGSGDEAGVRAAAERSGAELIRRPDSAGPSQARNDGLAVVQTPLVAFVDIDTECSTADLARLSGHFADPEVVAAAPRMTSKPHSSLLARYETCFSPLDLGDRPAAVGPGRAVAYVPSAVLVARTKTLRDLGGFDPQLRYGEDVDLIWRLTAAGHAARYDPEVAVDHQPRPSWAAWLRQRHDYGSAAAPLGCRHGRSVAPARCSVSSAAVWALIALGRPRAAAALAARSLRLLTDSLEGIPNARSEALKLAVRGHLGAGRSLAAATGRVWWPLAVGAAVAIRRLRMPVASALLAGPVLEYAGGRRPADPLRTVALRVLDQAAYGAGVWRGAIRERSIKALLPDLAGNAKPPASRLRVGPDEQA